MHVYCVYDGQVAISDKSSISKQQRKSRPMPKSHQSIYQSLAD